MDINENTYREYFTNFFEQIEEQYRTQWLKDIPEDEIMPGNLTDIKALRAKLPPSFIKILRLRLNRTQYPHAENEIYHLLLYSFNNKDTCQIHYSGEQSLDRLEKDKKLRQEWKIDDPMLQGLEDGTLIGYSDPINWWCFDVVPYDILAEKGRYNFDFLESFISTFRRHITREFNDEVDYNAKYNLQSDPILSYQELYDKGGTPYSITEYATGITRDKTFEDVQIDIAGVLLIPSVPDKVKQIFNVAKRLYVFSYMEYHFATVAMHYAYLAWESALRHKYNSLYESPKKHLSLHAIIEKLAKDKIIPKNEVELYKIAKYFRNEFSHPVDPLILMPNNAVDTIYSVAQDINYLFDEKKE